MTIRLAGMIVFGADTTKLAAFYEGALGFLRDHTGNGEDINLHVPTEGDGSIDLLLHPSASRQVDVGSFSVAGLDQEVERLSQHGATAVSSPEQTPWGTREASITDPEGNGLTLIEAAA